MFMIMLSVLSPLLFYVADIDNLYDDVLAERKESDVYRNIESINIDIILYIRVNNLS